MSCQIWEFCATSRRVPSTLSPASTIGPARRPQNGPPRGLPLPVDDMIRACEDLSSTSGWGRFVRSLRLLRSPQAPSAPASPLGPDVLGPRLSGGGRRLACKPGSKRPRRPHLGLDEEPLYLDHDLPPAAGADEGLSSRRPRSDAGSGLQRLSSLETWVASSPSGRRPTSKATCRRRSDEASTTSSKATL